MTEKMKIVHIVGYFQPQLGYEEYYVPKNQISFGNKVYIISSDRYYPFPHYNSIYGSILGDRFSPRPGYHYEKGIPTIRLPTLFELDSSIIFKHLKKALNNIKPDIAHIHGFFFPLALQALNASHSSCKIILDAHMIPFFPKKFNLSTLIKLSYFKIFHKILFEYYMRRKVQALYATKEQVAEYITKKYGVQTPIIPLGVDINLFNSLNYDSMILREGIGFNKDDFLLFYSGKIIAKKGLLDLIKIYNILRKESDNYGLLIIGNGPNKYVDFVKRKIKPEYKGNVRLIPFVNHFKLPEYMSLGNLGCWLGEIPSASINEFIGMGRPVLVKVFEGKNLLTSKYNFIQQYNSIDTAIDWIRYLAENPSSYESICRKARNFAVKSLDWKVTTKMIMKLYNSLY